MRQNVMLSGRAWIGTGVFLVIVGSTEGCGGSQPARVVPDGGVLVPNTPIAVADLCAPMVRGICQYSISCYGYRYQDLDQCVAETDCPGVPDLVSAVESGTVGYDASKGGQCYASFMSDPCHFGSFWFLPTVFEVLALCPGTVTPKLQAGQACVDSHECASGLYCWKSDFKVCPGTCTAYSQQGQSCGGTRLCVDGLFCRDGSCQPPAKAGDACQDIAGCNWGNLTCDDDEICSGNVWCDLSVGQCKAGVLEGGACGTVMGSGVGTTYFPTCAINLWCDSPSGLVLGTCRKKGAAGVSCLGSGSCLSGLHCEGDFSGASVTYGMCVGPGGSGKACGLSSDCQAGLACRGGLCSELGGTGASCSADDECAAGLFCHAGTCATANYPGSQCNGSDAFCAYGRCVGAVCTRFRVVGEACVSADECASGVCPSSTGKCYDDSLCAP
jgi:hypothetical protein